jgi:type II restriction/modification system DNA methylase subunit YeeA
VVDAKTVEAEWPRADAVVGNPPFLGVSRKRGELGEPYTRALDAAYAPGVPGAADLVCYWFEKARAQIAAGQLTAAGLVSTNSIRGGANRKVLDAIGETTRIYEAWSDEAWVNEGAAVRVSLVCFGEGEGAQLDGEPVPQIYADLTAPATAGDSLNLSKAQTLGSNLGASFQGASKKAKFEIDAALARDWLRLPNPNSRPNSDVLKPWANGFELSRGPQHQWIIDFGIEMPEAEAALYEQLFAYVTAHVKPERLKNNRESYRKYWWRFAEARPGLRLALKPLPRFIATIAHSKHRFFVWLPVTTSPDQALITVARGDDTSFGLLHSRFHELWSLRMGTSLEDRPRYTPTTCFETFPFPEGLTPADTAHQQTEAVPGSAHGALIPAQIADPALKVTATRIAEAAARLNALRENWLNPPEWTERVPEVVPLGMDRSPYPDRIVPKAGLSDADAKALQKRTLTNLYNQRPAWLAMAHEALDAAVAAAYGWADYTPQISDDEILARLLALNLQRANAA